MITRKQYISGEFSHEEYYSQWDTGSVRTRVLGMFSMTKLLASKDPHLNDLPLKQWDKIAVMDKHSLGSGVCIVKQAAKNMIAEHQAKIDLSQT